MAAKKGLGTGLDVLFGESAKDEEQKELVQSLPIAKVEPREGQPRTVFDEEALGELSESIREYGLLMPVTVRKLDSGYYQLIAGERRWRAARMAGLTEIPARVIEADDRLATELALVENLQREDLNPVEEAQGYRTLMEDYGLTQDEAAQRVGKSRPAVANALRLLSLAPEVLQFVEQGLLSAGHARALVPVKPEELQIDAARQVMKNGAFRAAHGGAGKAPDEAPEGRHWRRRDQGGLMPPRSCDGSSGRWDARYCSAKTAKGAG